MDPIFWLTYVAAPIVGGVVAFAGLASARNTVGRERSLAPGRAVLGLVLLGSAIHATVDLVEIAGGLNWKGRVLVVAIVLSQFGLGSLAALGAAPRYAPALAARAAPLREHLERWRRRLAALAIAGGLAMVLVRARVWLQIFS